MNMFRSSSRRWAACLSTAALLAACGGGQDGVAPASSTPPAAAADTRETTVAATRTVRWEGGGFDGIGIAAITPASDGGLWVLGAEGGLVGRPFLRKIDGANPCGADGQRFISELATRFERRQGPTSMSTVSGGRFYASFTGAGVVYVARFSEASCALDTSFGDAGVMPFPVSGLVTVTGIQVLRDAQDRVLVAASIPGQVLLRRLTSAGAWDGAFGAAGLASNANADGFWLSSMAATTAGDIYLAGAVSISLGLQPAILKLDDTGRPVAAFGVEGVQRYPEPSKGSGNAHSVLVEAGRLVFGVSTGDGVTVSDVWSNDSAIAAADPATGRLLPSFGAGGFLRWDWGYSNTEATGGWLPNGRGGYTGCGHVLKSLLAGQAVSRVDITATGLPDTTVPFQGRRLVAGTNSASCAGQVRLPDGRLAVAANDGGQAVVMFFDR